MKAPCTEDQLTRALRYAPTIPDGMHRGAKVTSDIVQAGTAMTIVSHRNWLMKQQDPWKVRLDSDFRVASLHADGTNWMNGTPQEISQMVEPMEMVRNRRLPGSRVLVGGLGLGILTHLMHRYAKATRVDTVENDGRVIHLVKDHVLHDEIIQADIHRFCETLAANQYDFAAIDSWAPTGESAWYDRVLPLRRALRGKVPVVWCWAEDEMQGQLRSALVKAMLFDFGNYGGWYRRVRPIASVADARGIAPAANRIATDDHDAMLGVLGEVNPLTGEHSNPAINGLVSEFLDVSSESWEAVFGGLWDAATMEGMET